MPEIVDRFAIYFSHSWRPRDVDLNLLVLDEIAGACELLVDVPEKPGADPPYYINRIEELLRRSDLFLSVLTERDSPAGDGEGDAALRCSPYSLFEIRLAERFNIPRLVLYERGTGFKSPRLSRPTDDYIAFDRGKVDAVPDQRHWRTPQSKIRRWMGWAAEQRRPITYEPSSLAVGLLPPHTPESVSVGDQLERVLREAGYESVEFRAACRSNQEAFQMLCASGLAVADLGVEDPVGEQLWAVAHALCVPMIRLIREPKDLPWLFQGHPGGYQRDIVHWTHAEELPALASTSLRGGTRTASFSLVTA